MIFNVENVFLYQKLHVRFQWYFEWTKRFYLKKARMQERKKEMPLPH